MGDRLGIPGAVDFLFIYLFIYLFARALLAGTILLLKMDINSSQIVHLLIICLLHCFTYAKSKKGITVSCDIAKHRYSQVKHVTYATFYLV